MNPRIESGFYSPAVPPKFQTKCERLLNERLDVTADGVLEPSDGCVIVEVEHVRDIEELVLGCTLGVHWIARLESVNRRRDGGFDVEYQVQKVDES